MLASATKLAQNSRTKRYSRMHLQTPVYEQREMQTSIVYKRGDDLKLTFAAPLLLIE